ncbi:S41 family peptidase [bacterium]|nr:S41 family peptidase [bacterium]
MNKDKQRKRVFIIALSSAILGIAISFYMFGPMSRVDAKDESYKELKSFSEVISYIQSNYVDSVDNKELVYSAIKGMLKDLDPHSSFMTPEMYKEMQVDTKGRFEGIGIEITIKDEQLTIVSPIEGTPAFEKDLKAGDMILKIDSVSTRDMTLSEAANRIRGPKGTNVVLLIWREGFDKPKEFTITRGVVKLASVSSRVLEGENIGYIRIRQFQENTTSDVKNAIKEIGVDKLDGLILDIRFNAGGLLNVAVDVADIFLPKDQVVVTTKGRVKEQAMVFKSQSGSLVPDFPIVVLVNAGSASASEILAGALKDWNRAVILGTKTFGKGSVQTIYPLDDGSAIRLTTAKYYTPKGTSIHGEGITPDILIENMVVEDKKRIITEAYAIREKDLIKMEESKKNKGVSEEKPEDEEEKEKDEEEKSGGYIEDLQLQRAIDIIKASLIFSSSRKG